MSKAISTALAVLVAGALGGAALGCGGYDEDEAKAACDAMVRSVVTTDDAAYQQCMDCHMECGDDCVVVETFPMQFSCEG